MAQLPEAAEPNYHRLRGLKLQHRLIQFWGVQKAEMGLAELKAGVGRAGSFQRP